MTRKNADAIKNSINTLLDIADKAGTDDIATIYLITSSLSFCVFYKANELRGTGEPGVLAAGQERLQKALRKI